MAVAYDKLEAGRVSQQLHDRLWYVAVSGVVLLVAGDTNRELRRPFGPPHAVRGSQIALIRKFDSADGGSLPVYP